MYGIFSYMPPRRVDSTETDTSRDSSLHNQSNAFGSGDVTVPAAHFQAEIAVLPSYTPSLVAERDSQAYVLDSDSERTSSASRTQSPLTDHGPYELEDTSIAPSEIYELADTSIRSGHPTGYTSDPYYVTQAGPSYESRTGRDIAGETSRRRTQHQTTVDATEPTEVYELPA